MRNREKSSGNTRCCRLRKGFLYSFGCCPEASNHPCHWFFCSSFCSSLSHWFLCFKISIASTNHRSEPASVSGHWRVLYFFLFCSFVAHNSFQKKDAPEKWTRKSLYFLQIISPAMLNSVYLMPKCIKNDWE